MNEWDRWRDGDTDGYWMGQWGNNGGRGQIGLALNVGEIWQNDY